MTRIALGRRRDASMISSVAWSPAKAVRLTASDCYLGDPAGPVPHFRPRILTRSTKLTAAAPGLKVVFSQNVSTLK